MPNRTIEGNEVFPGFWRTKGYDRQQWSTMLFDLYSDAPTIAIFDTDSVLQIAVHPRDIFTEDGRIILIGAGKEYMYEERNVKHNVGRRYLDSTLQAFGDREIKTFGSFMYGFPKVFWREDFEGLRKLLMEQMDTDDFATWQARFMKMRFELVKHLPEKERRTYSQFQLLGHYVANFRPDKYSIRLRRSSEEETEYDIPTIISARHMNTRVNYLTHFRRGLCWSSLYFKGDDDVGGYCKNLFMVKKWWGDLFGFNLRDENHWVDGDSEHVEEKNLIGVHHEWMKDDNFVWY